MQYRRMPIEIESPEEYGYDKIKYNLSESSFRDAQLGELNLQLKDLTLFYGEHRGLKALREKIASLYPGIEAEDILITVGAAAALFIIHTVLLEAGSHLVVQHPNYGTNLETPRALGAELSLWPLDFENQFQPDFTKLKSLLSPQTRLLSVTTPHNPSGSLLGPAQLEALLASHTAHILVDETYRELCFAPEAQAPLAASLDSRFISVSSMSKAYGLPGIRLGWIVCKDQELMEKFLAAKEQIFICNSVLDETVALQFLEALDQHLPRIKAQVAESFALLKAWMQAHPHLEWVEPQGGVVCFPRFKQPQAFQCERFYPELLENYATLVGPGHWFEMPPEYFRLGYAWPTPDALKGGLQAIDSWLAAAQKN